MFTNKRDAAFIIERKAALGACVEEDRVALIKSLITQDRKVAREVCYLSETRIGQKCELILGYPIMTLRIKESFIKRYCKHYYIFLDNEAKNVCCKFDFLLHCVLISYLFLQYLFWQKTE